jgi:RimJ/RimL family protein N-acetyltransferase
VRAIIEPLVERSKVERVPIWCVAGNDRARDVYAYFGFKVVKLIYSGEERVRTWCMVCNWPIE